jgi:hypothetical protein
MTVGEINNHKKPCNAESKSLEDAARAVCGTIMQDRLSDSEWARSRLRLLEFVNLLLNWDGAGKRTEQRTDCLG